MWRTTDPGGDVGAGVIAACQFTPQQVNPADGEGKHQHDQQHRYLQDTNTAELTFPCLLLFLYVFFGCVFFAAVFVCFLCVFLLLFLYVFVCVFYINFVLGLLSLDTLKII